MTTPPVVVYPPGYLQEYNGDILRNVAISFIVLVTAVVALRFYARSLSKATLGLEDVLIVPAYITCLSICILSFSCT